MATAHAVIGRSEHWLVLPLPQIHRRGPGVRRTSCAAEGQTCIEDRHGARRTDDSTRPLEQHRRAAVAATNLRGGCVDRCVTVQPLLLGFPVTVLEEYAEKRERIEVGSLTESLGAPGQRSNRGVELAPRPPLIEVVGRENRRRRPERLQRGDGAPRTAMSGPLHRIIWAVVTTDVDLHGRHGVEPECFFYE